MRKDYLPVEDHAKQIDEAAFVEQYWTDQWDVRDIPPDSNGVVRSEEYRIMRPYLDRLAPGSRILDGGCGLGEWTAFLSGRGFSVTGVDISAHTVRRLNQRYPTLDFRCADVRATGFEPASFDLYFSWGTFEHYEAGLGGCMSEARRIVKPGGLLFVSVPFHNRRHMLRDRRSAGASEHSNPAGGDTEPQRFYQWRLTKPELQHEFAAHGFTLRELRTIGKLTGAGRMLQWDLPLFTTGSGAYRVARRALATALPSSFIGHMILAVGERSR